MSKGSPPAAPDPTATAAAQTQSNIATANNNAALNRIDQYTPLGSSTYDITGTNADGTPTYSQTVSLSPGEQNLFNMQLQGQQALGSTALNSLGGVQSAYSQPFSFGGPGVTSSINNSGPGITGQITNGANAPNAIQQAEDAAYKQQTQYLDPQYAQGQQSLDAKLANEGLQTGDTAYNNAQQMYGLQENQAYGNAGLQAVQAGQQEQNTLFGQGLSAANLQNQANQQGFGQGLSAANLQNQASAQSLNQQLGLYNQPLNSYNALMTGAQVQNPNFSSVPTVNQAGTDVAGITNNAYQNQLARYQASQSGINNLFSLGGSLGAAAILA